MCILWLVAAKFAIKKMRGFLSLTLLSVSLTVIGATTKLDERYTWTELDWQFPNEMMKMQALASGTYIPRNGLPVGVERSDTRLFVTVPRWRDGIPATLNYIDMDKNPAGHNIPLIPYQNNVAGDCANGLTTVYRIKADKCGRLWVLDTGTIGIGNTTENVCPYAINVFDLQTNRRLRRYELRPEDTNANTFIANTAIDIGANCEDTFAYFSDELGYGLIAYSWEQNKSWRFEHSFFFPDPLRGDFNIAGLNFQWGEEGIFGMALSPMLKDGFRVLYFSPLASHREFAVSTRILRNETKVEDGYHDFVYLPERAEDGHTTSRVMNDEGLQLFNLIDQNAVGCWHSSLPYAPENHDIIDKDDVTLVFPSDVKIDETSTVWVMSDRMPVFLIAELDYTDINFRIFSGSLQSLVEGTVCDTTPKYLGKHIPTIPIYTKVSPSSHIFNAQKQTIPKAYAFNEHNGVTFEANHHYTPSALSYLKEFKQFHGLGDYSKPSWYKSNQQ
ncbi:protein yellow-like [Culicoides brevitarsis]|uniref:protein yellow-like n=1 Tax=Culicoides brevitarsis TaxID=469753 RepID=UPI00307B1376